MRHTPAGLPAIDLQLEHTSSIEEAGQMRQLSFQIKAVAFAAVAERLARQALGSEWVFSGFLASAKGGKHPVLHIDNFRPVQVLAAPAAPHS